MRLLDLFCGAGGAAMGYHRAGFDQIVGVDIKPQPRYPFEFVQGDALEYLAAHGSEFDVIHASPPCQAYSVTRVLNGRPQYWDSIPPTRAALKASGRPYVIENVIGAPLYHAALVCGLTLGLQVKRHRLFESNLVLFSTTCPPSHPGEWKTVVGEGVSRKHLGRTDKWASKAPRRDCANVKEARAVMGIDWMGIAELSQAIPPAYTEFIGRQLLSALEAVA